MATVINNPAGTTDSSSSGMSFVLGAILLIAAVLIFFYYGVPAMRSAASGVGRGTNLSVPDKIDVNVNNPGNNSGGSGDNGGNSQTGQ
jgi:hypothetical protein